VESTDIYRKPSKWVAAALGLFIPPAGMLYVARPGWAAIYLALTAVIGIVDLLVLREPAWAGGAAALLVATVCAVQAYRYSRDDRVLKRPWYGRRASLLAIVAAFAALVLGARALLFEPFRLPSASMLPSIEPGARLIVKKWGYGNYGTYGIHFARAGISSELSRGDIVVFEYPRDRTVSYVKRIIGLPGDNVAYFSKRLWVNEQEAPRKRIGDYVYKDRLVRSPQYLERLGEREYPVLIDAEARAFVPPAKAFPLEERCTFMPEGMSCRVPAGHYFVLGDNRDNSADSRNWGFVPAENIVGKVEYILP